MTPPSLAVTAANVAWSVLSGPLTSISASGLATAGPVYQDTASTAQGIYLGDPGTLALTVKNVSLDNFGTYAADTIDDAPNSRFTLSIAPVPAQPTQKKLTFAPIVAGRTYTVKAKADLASASWDSVAVSAPTDNGPQRTVTDTSSSGAKKFYHIEITKPQPRIGGVTKRTQAGYIRFDSSIARPYPSGVADITLLLQALRDGKPDSASALLTSVYAELRKMARAKMAQERPGHTLQATALVHEVWLRLGEQRFENRAHFFTAAAEAMRRILISSARRRAAVRNGGGIERVNVDEVEIASPTKDDELLAIHKTLDALAEHDARKAELVKLRYFAGLSIEEAADVLGISAPTAKRDWTYARAWLFREIGA